MNYEHLVADSVREVPPSGIRKFFDIASEMKNVISMSVGEPDFITPWNIRSSAIASIERGMTHYTSNSGLLELRKLISAYLKTRFRLNYAAEDMLMTVGASEALDLAFRTIINPGDEVLVPAPSYVSYEPGVRFSYGVPVAVETGEENNFVITPEAIEKVVTPKTKAIVIPYPNNPTGATLRKEDIDAILPVIEKYDLLIIADEVYAELTYGGEHVSIAEGQEHRTIYISGFSKAFAMTGWRLGYVAGPEPILKAMLKIHQYTMLCAPIMSQVAGLEAIKTEMSSGYAQIKEMVRNYNLRRVYVLEHLRDMGFSCFEPKGAFYVFPNISFTGLTSEEFCGALLTQKRVACVPGSAFGKNGEGFIRCSYATSMEDIAEAMKRIREFKRELDKK